MQAMQKIWKLNENQTKIDETSVKNNENSMKYRWKPLKSNENSMKIDAAVKLPSLKNANANYVFQKTGNGIQKMAMLTISFVCNHSWKWPEKIGEMARGL